MYVNGRLGLIYDFYRAEVTEEFVAAKGSGAET